MLSKLKDTLFAAFFIPFMIAYAFGGIAGVIVALTHNDALAVLLSLIIPMFGAIYTIATLFF